MDEVDYNCDKRISQLQTQNIQDSYQSDIDYTIDPIDVIADIPKFVISFYLIFIPIKNYYFLRYKNVYLFQNERFNGNDTRTTGKTNN